MLIVEDEADTAALMQECLARAGYRTLHARDGQSALRLAPEHTLATVLLDWRLPAEPSGAALVRRLRALCRYRLPIIVVSGDPQSLSEARNAGVEDYLPKPFTLEDLIHVVDEHAR